MANWLQYDWDVHGIPAIYTVDLDLSEPLAGYETLLWISCISSRPDAKMFDPGELRACERAFKKTVNVLDGAVYVGCIDLPAQRQYYFYTSKEEDLDALSALKERKLLLESGRAHEPKWQTYANLLYPDAAKFQTVENGRIIALLTQRGDQVGVNRRLSLNVFFPTEPTRILFEEQARVNGFAIGKPLFVPEQPLPYGVTIYCLSTLDKRTVDAITTRVIRIAASMDGMLMNWDCALVPKKVRT